MHDGTSTAGETAPRQKPRAIASNQGKSKMNLAAIPLIIASPNYGPTVSKTTVNPFPLNDNSRPPIIKIIDKHTYLTQSAIGSKYTFGTLASKIFLAMHPIKSIPTKGGI